MLDNLRRTLSAPAMFLTLLAGWLISPLSPWMWTAFILHDDFNSAAAAVPARPQPASRRNFLAKPHPCRCYRIFRWRISQIGLTITFLAYQAWLMSDAILRTLFRLWITRRNLLEWADRGSGEALPSIWKFSGSFEE